MKTLLKWFFALVLMLAVLAGVFLLSLDTLLRVTAEQRIRAQTGMDAEIGKFHLGLLEPVITIKDLQIHNPPAFGGTPFLSVPEIHLEYDRAALFHREIHLTLLRLNLAELDIVKNEAGQTNLFLLGAALPAKKSATGGNGAGDFHRQTGLAFKGLDVLNISIGTVKFIDLKNPHNNRAQKIGIENCVMKNVKSPTDLAGLAVLVALRGGDFFGSLAAPTGWR